MAILSIREIFDIIVMTGVLGFIFMNFFSSRIKTKNPFDITSRTKYFDKEGFINAIIITAPAIILHEFGHKFVAIAFGLTAQFNAAYSWLFLAVILKLLAFPFIFFVPAYVSITGVATPLQHSITAFAGPAVNLLIWLGIIVFFEIAKARKLQIKRKTMTILLLTKKINMFLFIFNMLPIPMFDGYQVFSGLIQTIF
jgi:Zn-dependent protease